MNNKRFSFTLTGTRTPPPPLRTRERRFARPATSTVHNCQPSAAWLSMPVRTGWLCTRRFAWHRETGNRDGCGQRIARRCSRLLPARKTVRLLNKIALIGAASVFTGCLYTEVPHGREDRRVVVRASDVAKFLDESTVAFAPSTRRIHSRFSKRISAAGAYTLAYSYGNEEEQLSIRSTATIVDSGDADSAREIFYASLQNHRATENREQGVRLVPLPITVGKADDSRFYLILQDGRPIGNAFAAWRGNVATDLRLTGVYFDEPSSFRRLVTPKFARLSRFDPETSTLAPRRSRKPPSAGPERSSA